jgi:hypothetical protein
MEKVTVLNFKVRLSENHWKFDLKLAPLVSRRHRLTGRTGRPRARATPWTMIVRRR